MKEIKKQWTADYGCWKNHYGNYENSRSDGFIWRTEDCISEGFQTNDSSYGEQQSGYVRIGTEAVEKQLRLQLPV